MTLPFHIKNNGITNTFQVGCAIPKRAHNEFWPIESSHCIMATQRGLQNSDQEPNINISLGLRLKVYKLISKMFHTSKAITKV